jgi:hypothetical protein
MTDYSQRHPGIQHLARYFEYAHLPQHLQEVSAVCGDLAHKMIATLPDGPELTAGLRKLLEAKDCFVRAAVDLASNETDFVDQYANPKMIGRGE